MSVANYSFDGPDFHSYSGYLAPSRSGRGPGIIVIQEWWGLVGHISTIADRFANEGFTALAPDFYKGEVAEEPEVAGKLMMALNIGETERILRGAIEAILAEESATGEKVGVVGFCMGGQLALFAACLNDEIGACVDFYGIHPNVQPVLENLRSPLLGFFAEHDEYASPEAVSALSGELKLCGKQHEFVTYPGTHHAFFNDDRPEVYDANAAADAWSKMIGFFKKHLG
ncbi:MAG TPA: dienelactone hydrolase family protein [Fimbriimonadaceae bacterium]|nr:dienelactone hydrolase family protein [Fimbriimonadaceae bacterium]